MTDKAELASLVSGIVDAIREPLGLDRWSLRVMTGALDDARASCEASPEYREARLCFDFDKLQTGDDLQEIAVHESAHCVTWPLHTLAETLADAVADQLPKHQREAVRTVLREQVRIAGEQVTTDVGQTYLRLLRRAGVLAA